MSLPAVLIRKSTGEILKRSLYPREDMGTIDGLDPDLEWLLVYIPFNVPDYDPRVFILNTTEEITTTPHPDYSNLNQFLITYTTIKRDIVDIEYSLKNAENIANEGIVSQTDFNKLVLLALGVIIRYSKGQTLTQKEIDMMNKILSIAVKVWKNDDNFQLLLNDYTLGNEPNIDAGWENIL